MRYVDHGEWVPELVPAVTHGVSGACGAAPRAESWATTWGVWDILGGAALGLMLAAALVR
jgi:hypothetical protein